MEARLNLTDEFQKLKRKLQEDSEDIESRFNF